MSLNNQISNDFKQQNNLRLEDDIVVIPTWIQKRVSSKPQVGKVVKGIYEEKASLEEQGNNCEKFITEYKGRCPKCSKEIRLIYAGTSTAKGQSGQLLEREDTEEFLRLAKEGKFKVLVTNDNDRIARSRATGVMIREKLKKMGVQIYSLSQPVPLKCPDCFDFYDDDPAIMVETMSDMKSQLDLAKIRRNYKIGMPHRIEKGKPSGSLGYGLMKKYRVIDKDSSGSDILETYYEWDINKVAIVKRIAKDYLDGVGVWKICQNLNNEGIPSSHGKHWGRSAIMVILKNPAYAGYVRWGWKTTKNGIRTIQPKENWMMVKTKEYNSIWENDTYYDKIQTEIKRKATVGGRTTSSNANLIGLLKCGYCGRPMYQTSTHKTLKNGTKYFFRGYGCGSFLNKGTCRPNGKKQIIIDDLVIKEVLKLANEKTRKAYLEKVNKSKFDKRLELFEYKEKELVRRTDEYNRIHQAYKEGVDSLAEYKKNKEEMLPIIEILQREVISLGAKANAPIVKIDWNKKYKLILNKFITSHSEENTKNIRNILFRLIDKIEFKSKPLHIKIFYKTAPRTL